MFNHFWGFVSARWLNYQFLGISETHLLAGQSLKQAHLVTLVRLPDKYWQSRLTITHNIADICHYFELSLSLDWCSPHRACVAVKLWSARRWLSVAAAAAVSEVCEATGVTSQRVGPGTAQLRAEPHFYSVFII